MNLSLQADYSCRVLIYLALRPAGVRSSIEEIARAHAVSENHLVKVVHLLGKLGFVETARGRGGGLSLARAPEDIAIGEVIRRTEPSLAVVECLRDAEPGCVVNGACGLKPWLAKATIAFLDTLDRVTLADVVAKKKGLATALGLAPRAAAE